jgi:porin
MLSITRLWAAAALCAGVGLLAFCPTASADEGLGGFGHLTEPAQQPPISRAKPTVHPKKPAKTKKQPRVNIKPEVPAEPWGPVPTEKTSIANLAPGLLPYFNNAPVFGLPGTVTGSFWDRTQLTGDWGGVRTDLARHGFFFDLYSTSAYQDVSSGGLKTGNAFVQNTQLSINIDTGRANLWRGGLIHFTVQSRYGSDPGQTFTVGSYVPQYTALVLPGPLQANDVLPSEYFLVQSLSKEFSVVLGKISDVFIPDQTLFGNSYKYYFANFNLNKNPMTTNFYHPTAWAALGVWTPAKWLAIAGGVLDPNTQANNFATDAFDKVNLYLTAVASYNIAGLPGQFSPAFNWSNKPKINLVAPFGTLTSLPQVTQAVGVLVGSGMTNGLPINFNSESWFAIANLSQYLFVKDDPATIAEKLKSGQVINGIGIFGRVGYAPANSNTVVRDASVGLFAHGLYDARPYDSFGVGWYWNEFSNYLKNDITTLTAGMSSAKNESGIEAFYDFAVTPAIRIIPSYQHVWNPLAAEVANHQNKADVFLGRVTIAF